MQWVHKYPFLLLLLPLITGISIGYVAKNTLTAWPLLFITIGSILLLTIIYFFDHHKWGRKLFMVFALLCLSLIGMYVTIRTWNVTQLHPLDESEGIYETTLEDYPKETPKTFRFTASIEGRKCFLYIAKDTASRMLTRGDVIRFKARLQPFKHFNDTFDYPNYARRKGYAGSAYIKGDRWYRCGHQNSRTFLQRMKDVQRMVADEIRSWNLGTDEQSLLLALTLGDRDELSEDLRETYNIAGAGHVLALSGLHVGLLFAVMIGISRKLWKRWNVLKVPCIILTIVVLWLFACLTGLTSSVVRSVAVFSLMALGLLQYERLLSLNILAVAAFFMLFIRPMWLMDVGFQLSFVAVAAIILLTPKLNGLWKPQHRLLRYVWALICASLSAQIAVAPLLMYYFHRISIHFIITSLYAIPSVTVILYLAILCFVLIPVKPLLLWLIPVLKYLLHTQNQILKFISELPCATISDLQIGMLTVTFCYVTLTGILFIFLKPTFIINRVTKSGVILLLLLLPYIGYTIEHYASVA